jgi:Tol biopolymer transport system component
MRRYRLFLLALALPLLAAADIGHGATKQYNIDIVAVDLAGHRTNLTHNPAIDANPAVARDGRIAFFTDRIGGGLDVMDAKGGNVRLVTASGGIELAEDLEWSQASWAPMGDRIAFDGLYMANPSPPCPQHCAGWHLLTVGLDGSGLREIARNARAPSWSPDGRHLAYNSGVGPNDLGGASGVTIARADGSGAVQVPVYNQYDNVGPVWSPGGGELAFQGQRTGGAFSTYVVRADGMRKRRLASGQDPSWSPDGRRLAFVDNCRLLTIGRNGIGKRRLSRKGELVVGEAWAPKGNLIAYLAGTNPGYCGPGLPSNLRLETVTADGRRVRILARESAVSLFGGGSLAPVWAPSGKRILVTGEPH